ncbi:hypothetical protein HB780_22560 [Rhizobium lusitanum]|uniref:hypothetical protein n=1 Tax=Rhizobium lusitanum TaxID=293958 RepID=UPI00160780C3|nr:hypothetical protein [Rhizobium lusitanum]QND48395.1 hypothetical protein HB780_22560 [Rhizobium lusitanum]
MASIYVGRNREDEEAKNMDFGPVAELIVDFNVDRACVTQAIETKKDAREERLFPVWEVEDS